MELKKSKRAESIFANGLTIANDSNLVAHVGI